MPSPPPFDCDSATGRLEVAGKALSALRMLAFKPGPVAGGAAVIRSLRAYVMSWAGFDCLAADLGRFRARQRWRIAARMAAVLCEGIVISSLAVGVADGAGPRSDTRIAVSVVPVTPTEIPVTYTLPGSVVSDARINISSRVVGFIQQLDVREGQSVSRGELLVRIDPSDIDETIRQAEATVRASQGDLDDARQDVERYARLVPSGTASAETLRKARVRADVARAVLDRSVAALAAAEAQRSYATIVSPVDGIIVSVVRRSGEMATAGTTILTVESREILLFKGYIAERQLSLIDRTSPVAVRIDVLDDAPPLGRIRGIVPSGDDVTRRYEVNIVLPNDPRLVPGMFGRADFVLGRRQILQVPPSAIVRRGGLEGVFVLDGNRARFRWLRTGSNLGHSIEVVAGLTTGERVLVEPGDAVRDGSVVQPIEISR